jgi:hypothetical protein
MGLLSPDWPAANIIGFGNPKNWDCKKKHDCTAKEVNKLVRSTLGVDLEKMPATYVVIHVVNYGTGSENSLSDSWYVYHSRDSKWSFQKFTSQRIYGSPTTLFLFVHLNARGLSAGWENAKGLSEQEQNTRKLEWDALQHDSGIPDPVDPKQPPTMLCADGTNTHFQWLGTGAISSDYANVHYESAVVKRTPANIANLLNILKILGLTAQGGQSCRSIVTNFINIWGAGRIDNIGLPSDVTISGYSTGKNEPLKDADRSKSQIGGVGAFNDEQLYWWDASIGIPVHKIKDLQYSSSDNTVVASQVDKQSAYAMFNLMLRPVDLSDPKSNVWPRILAGFPLSSNPWDALFAGGAVGVPWKPLQNFQFFAGATFNRSAQPSTLTAGDSATNAQLQNNLTIKTTPKFTFGINVPVKSVLDKLLK